MKLFVIRVLKNNVKFFYIVIFCLKTEIIAFECVYFFIVLKYFINLLLFACTVFNLLFNVIKVIQLHVYLASIECSFK